MKGCTADIRDKRVVALATTQVHAALHRHRRRYFTLTRIKKGSRFR